MSLLKLLLAGTAIGVILIAFRDFDNRRWLAPLGPGGATLEEEEEEEPILGYDGMDEETLLEWMDGADLDRDTLARMRAYERAHQCREPVLRTLDDRL
jgi:hypothetical protein